MTVAVITAVRVAEVPDQNITGEKSTPPPSEEAECNGTKGRNPGLGRCDVPSPHLTNASVQVRLTGPGSLRTPQTPIGPQDAQKEKQNLA